tara:strand:+ start:142 stop:531 length:390 start_codon:yes stop_codon:yes gene_type:complete
MGHGASTFFKGLGGGLEEAGHGIKEGFDELGDTPFMETLNQTVVKGILDPVGDGIADAFGHVTGEQPGDQRSYGGSDSASGDKNNAPTVNQFVMPKNFADRQSTLQRGTANPASTSHNSTARFGVASHV